MVPVALPWYEAVDLFCRWKIDSQRNSGHRDKLRESVGVKKRTLDFSLMPDIAGMDIFIRLGGDLENKLKDETSLKIAHLI